MNIRTECLSQISQDQFEKLRAELQSAFARLLPQLSPRLDKIGDQTLERILRGEGSALVLSRDEADRVVGLLTLVWYDAASGRKAWIEDVVVDESARGCGVGRSLVARALEFARGVEADCVMLTSSPHRTAAHALYSRMGFEKKETTVFVGGKRS